MERWLVGVAFASGVFAPAVDVRRFFHGLARGAAVFARRGLAGTDWVRTLFGFCRGHFFSPYFGIKMWMI
jgi:hypothetical protein